MLSIDLNSYVMTPFVFMSYLSSLCKNILFIHYKQTFRLIFSEKNSSNIFKNDVALLLIYCISKYIHKIII